MRTKISYKTIDGSLYLKYEDLLEALDSQAKGLEDFRAKASIKLFIMRLIESVKTYNIEPKGGKNEHYR